MYGQGVRVFAKGGFTEALILFCEVIRMGVESFCSKKIGLIVTLLMGFYCRLNDFVKNCKVRDLIIGGNSWNNSYVE